MTVALGTSMPTSTTEVATRTSSSPALKARIDASFSSPRHPAVQQPHAQVGEDRLLESRVLLDGGLGLAVLRFLDQRVDDERLAAARLPAGG